MRISIRKLSVLAILILLLTSVICSNVFAETDDTKLKAFIVETQKNSDTTFAWWLPQEYWKTSAEQFASSSKETATAMEIYSEYFRPYIVMLVAHAEPSSSGKIRFLSESDLLSEIRLIDERGFTHYPLVKKKINPNFGKFLRELKPTFTENLGTLGKHMYFVVFDAEDNNGLIVDTTKETRFKIRINRKELFWQLPFESLIPSRVCPRCHQNLNGKFKFCPWDGTPLS